MSVAIIQGASGGQALALTSHILRNTGMKVYALTHGKGNAIQDHLGDLAKDRLTVVDGVDLKEERGLEDAAKMVKDREGKAAVRLIACFAGILHAEKSLSAIDPATVLSQFQVNTIGHLLTYKRFVPLLPTKKQWRDVSAEWKDGGDPARGLVGKDNSLCWSMSARVGSISGNEKGGWYSYRASKAALNQVIRCVDHEVSDVGIQLIQLVNKSSSGVAVAYHPGTVLTSFSKAVVGQNAKPDPSHGRFGVDEALGKMTDLMGKVERDGDGAGSWGGGFYDWKGERVEW